MEVHEKRSCILIATTDGKFQAYVPQEVQVKELVSRYCVPLPIQRMVDDETVR